MLRMYQLRAEIYLADELVGRFSFTKQIAASSAKPTTSIRSEHNRGLMIRFIGEVSDFEANQSYLMQQ